MSKAYWCLRGVLHRLFNIHWYTTMDIGSNDPYEHCEFCGKSRRMRDQCAEDKHYWVKVFFTTDTQHCPAQINAFYNQADVIFHDCETTAFPSGVHAHYKDLVSLPENVKHKTHLIHYMPDDEDESGPFFRPDQAISDGFRGFVSPGTVFDLTGDCLSEDARR